MALAAYLWARGTMQGDIVGSVTQFTREGGTMVYAAQQRLIQATDPASGLPTRARQHAPYVVHAEVDRAFPMFVNAWTNLEALEYVRIQFYRPRTEQMAGVGTELHYFTVEMTNAYVCSVNFQLPHVREHPGLETEVEYAFAYERIEWTWLDGGIVASDDWFTAPSAPNEGGERRRRR
jgi:type VI secretion system secreted protein Hcp